jgi:hypothetical protein
VIGADAKVCEIEELDLPAGKFNTIRVKRKYALNSTSGECGDDEWFSPGIGRVKMLEYHCGGRPFSFPTVLKSFTPGRQ